MAISFFFLIVFSPPSLHDLISDYRRMDTNEGERGKGLPEREKKAPENGNHQKQTGDTAERASSLLI